MLALADPSAVVAMMVTDRVPVTCCGGASLAEVDIFRHLSVSVTWVNEYVNWALHMCAPFR
jgi:hypothetical protein